MTKVLAVAKVLAMGQGQSEFQAGRESAQREITSDRWSRDLARRYLDMCAEAGCREGRDEFDRGFIARVEELAGSP